VQLVAFFQYTGSCWFNSTLNAIILTKKIASLLKNKWNNLDTFTKNKLNISYEQINSNQLNLNEIILVIVNNLLIKKQKASSNVDFTTKMASILYSNYNPTQTYTSGGDPERAIFPLLKSLFNTNEYNIIDLAGFDYYNNYVNLYNEKVDDSFIKKYENKSNIGDLSKKLIDTKINIYLNKKKRDDYKIKLNQNFNNIPVYNETMTILNQLIKENNKLINDQNTIFNNVENIINNKLDSYYNSINNKKDIVFDSETEQFFINTFDNTKMPNIIAIVHFKKDFNKACSKITIMNTVYNLEACIFGPYPGHAIAGLNCNNIEYVYDSNNIIAYDNWSDGNIDNYAKQNKNAQFNGILTLIYIKNDLTGGATDYYSKYMKYKTKYLELQNKLKNEI
jgi:hypothetical protein